MTLAPAATPQTATRTYTSLAAAWIPLAALCLAFFVEMVDNTLLSIALPTIVDNLSCTVSEESGAHLPRLPPTPAPAAGCGSRQRPPRRAHPSGCGCRGGSSPPPRPCRRRRSPAP